MATSAATATRNVPADPIETAEDVIARTLSRLPAGFEPTDVVARLVTRHTFEEWSTAGVADITSEEPIWVVGVRADDLTVGDVLPITDSSASQEIEGAYMAWDAETGDAYEQGVLGGPWTKTFDSIEDLPEIQ